MWSWNQSQYLTCTEPHVPVTLQGTETIVATPKSTIASMP